MDLTENLLNRLEIRLDALATAYQTLQQQYQQVEQAKSRLERENQALQQKNQLARERLTQLLNTLKLSLPELIQIDDQRLPATETTIEEENA